MMFVDFPSINDISEPDTWGEESLDIHSKLYIETACSPASTIRGPAIWYITEHRVQGFRPLGIVTQARLGEFTSREGDQTT